MTQRNITVCRKSFGKQQTANLNFRTLIKLQFITESFTELILSVLNTFAENLSENRSDFQQINFACHFVEFGGEKYRRFMVINSKSQETKFGATLFLLNTLKINISVGLIQPINGFIGMN